MKEGIPMPKAKTIAQFCLYHFLDAYFDLTVFRMTPADDGVMLEDGEGRRAVFQYQDGAVVMQTVKKPDAAAPSQPFNTGFTAGLDRARPPRDLTLQQITELPEMLLSYYKSHQLPTDAEVRRLAQTGRVSGEDYMGILLWYLAGNYQRHYLGLGGVDGEGCCIDLIFQYQTPQEDHIQFYLEDLPPF